MIIEKLSNDVNAKELLVNLGVDGGGVKILSSKMKHHIIHIKDLHVGGANILKQDALSVGADLAVPRGTVIATTPKVDCVLIATQRQLQSLSKKELSQPFGLKELAHRLSEIIKAEKPRHVEIKALRLHERVRHVQYERQEVHGYVLHENLPYVHQGFALLDGVPRGAQVERR